MIIVGIIIVITIKGSGDSSVVGIVIVIGSRGSGGVIVSVAIVPPEYVLLIDVAQPG